MRQYQQLREELAEDTLLFFRMGDFYELFLDDAERAAPLMEIALTRRQNEIPMCGVPYHSAESYIARILEHGLRVALAEQFSDPKNPKLMMRRIVRIVSAGTLLEDSLLTGSGHNYLIAIAITSSSTSSAEGLCGIALCDVSTGDFFTLEIEPTQATLRDLYYRYSPRELLIASDRRDQIATMLPEMARSTTLLEPWKASASEGARRITSIFGRELRGLGYDRSDSPALAAVSLVLHYLNSSFASGADDTRLPRLAAPALRPEKSTTLRLDEQTIRNLDLVWNQQEGSAERTLFKAIDRTLTAAGRRRLRDSILQPLRQIEAIEERQNLVARLLTERSLAADLRRRLRQLADIERIVSRLAARRIDASGLVAIGRAISIGGELSTLLGAEEFAPLDESLNLLAETLIAEIVAEPDPPGSGRFLHSGIDAELDQARAASSEGSEWLLEFERREKSRTGLSTLKVKYNGVVGYFIELSKNQAVQAPFDYLRKQTLVGNERFTTDELGRLEATILSADATIRKCEEAAAERLALAVVALSDPLRELAAALARIDLLASLAEVAAEFGWVRPLIGAAGSALRIEAGRHPVVEAFLEPGEEFIANDLIFDQDERRFAILTGPNMAGKSTYLRQTALIQLLAQIGSFVPCRVAALPLVDRIFTRIGAADNLTRGESTFYVEMVETARILHQSTPASLVIMDEVGRGTSTYDGLSIAWAVLEELSPGEEAPQRFGPLVLFATHYHELTSLARRRGVFNLTMDVRNEGGRLLFLHRVREGAADDSYGIHVARLAGLPERVVERAWERLAELEQRQPPAPPAEQMATDGELNSAKRRRKIPGAMSEDLEQLALF